MGIQSTHFTINNRPFKMSHFGTFISVYDSTGACVYIKDNDIHPDWTRHIYPASGSHWHARSVPATQEEVEILEHEAMKLEGEQS